jgi:hypothetical protein
MLEVVLMTADVQVGATAQDRQEAFFQRMIVTIRAVGVDGMVTVDNLPARLAPAELRVEPIELGARDQVGV